MAGREAQELVGGVLAERSAVATLERATSVAEFLDGIGAAGSLAGIDPRQAVDEVLAALYGHDTTLDGLAAGSGLEEELEEVELQLRVQTSPASLLSGSIDASFPGTCWSTRVAATKDCSY